MKEKFKTVHYGFYANEINYKEVLAERIKIGNFECFIFKQENFFNSYPNWNVSHIATGMRICEEMSKKGAIKKATERLLTQGIYDVWDWVVTIDGITIQINSDDQMGLPYERIKRHATEAEIKEALKGAAEWGEKFEKAAFKEMISQRKLIGLNIHIEPRLFNGVDLKITTPKQYKNEKFVKKISKELGDVLFEAAEKWIKENI